MTVMSELALALFFMIIMTVMSELALDLFLITY